MKKILP